MLSKVEKRLDTENLEISQTAFESLDDCDEEFSDIVTEAFECGGSCERDEEEEDIDLGEYDELSDDDLDALLADEFGDDIDDDDPDDEFDDDDDAEECGGSCSKEFQSVESFMDDVDASFDAAFESVMDLAPAMECGANCPGCEECMGSECDDEVEDFDEEFSDDVYDPDFDDDDFEDDEFDDDDDDDDDDAEECGGSCESFVNEFLDDIYNPENF